MSYLNLVGSSGSARIVERLVLERSLRSAKSVGFDDVEVDEAILQAAVELFRDRQQQHNQQQQQQQQQHQQQQQRGFTIDELRTQSNSNASNPGSSKNKTSNVKLEKLSINNCPANSFLEYLIEVAMGTDLFREFELQGPEEELPVGEGGNEKDEYDDAESAAPTSDDIFALDALGFRMRFSRRLRKLELINLPITRDHAESLMYGIETNVSTGTGCRLDTLVMEGVRFVHDEDEGEENDGSDGTEEDGGDDDCNEDQDSVKSNDGKEEGMTSTTPGDGTVVVKELCEGFPNNSTLKSIKMERCGLTDAQIALIFVSLAHHPTLTNLILADNACRKLGLEALDRILVSPQWIPNSVTDENDSSEKHFCKIESLDLSYQFTSEETYGTEHIQLDILTRNCTTIGADFRIYPNLRELILQGNQIDDSDMEHLAFLIRHRFPLLEDLDLRFNEISTEGLEAFTKHSDPSNDNDNASDTQKHKDHFPPPSSRLRIIRLTNNPLVMTNQTSVVILKLLKIYPELTQIQSNLEWEDQSPIAQDIQHLFDINRAGRVLLKADSSGNKANLDSGNKANLDRLKNINRLRDITRLISGDNVLPYSNPPKEIVLSKSEQRRRQLSEQERRPIPLAAWPLVLARLTRETCKNYIPPKDLSNGMYYLIRHGPIIMEQMASRSNKRSSNSNSNSNSNTAKKEKEKIEMQEIYRKRKRDNPDPALGGYETIADFLRCELGVTS